MFTIIGRRLSGQQQTRPRKLGGSSPPCLGAAALAALPIMAMGVALAAPASADPSVTITKVFGYTGHKEAFLVPDGEARRRPLTQVSTTTVVSASPPASHAGDLVKYTATVRRILGTVVPTGTVKFTVGGTLLCDHPILLDATGQAVCESSKTPPGSDTVTATYAGSLGSKVSEGTTTETVSWGYTTMVVSASPSASRVGDLVRYTATVRPVSGTAVPTGPVKFSVGSTQLCDSLIPLDASGQAVCESSRTPLGSAHVDAFYFGSRAAGFAGSDGKTTETVTASQTAPSPQH